MAGKRRMFGPLVWGTLAGAIVVVAVVQGGWWVGLRLPAWRDGWRLEAAARDIRSPNPKAAREAVLALGWAVPRSLPYLQAAARDGDAAVRLRAMEALMTRVHAVPDGWPTIHAGLDDPEPKVRRLAMALTSLPNSPLPPAATDRLAKLLADADPFIRSQAAWALFRAKPEARDLVEPVFLAFLGDPDLDPQFSRAGFCAVIPDLSPPSRARAVAALLGLATVGRPNTRREAIECLGLVDPPAREAIPELTRLLADPSLVVRHAAALALHNAEHVDAGRMRGLLADLHERGLVPPDLRSRVATFLGSSRPDEASFEPAHHLLAEVIAADAAASQPR